MGANESSMASMEGSTGGSNTVMKNVLIQLHPKTSRQVIIPLAWCISAAMMFDQGFSIHHEAHKGHEVRTTGLEKQPEFNMLFSSFVLFVSFVVVYFG